MKRRAFIKSTGFSTVTALLGSSFLLKACHTEEDMIGKPNWIIEGGFNRPLVTPAIINSDNINLAASPDSKELLRNKVSNTLSYSNGILGPLIKTTAGQTVNVHLQNNLAEETNIHWHGLILPEHMDGHPKDTAHPGESLHYNLPILQRAGTYWYHPHPHGLTAKQVFMGLAGMFIVNDEEEAALNLPSDEREIPLIIQDKRFSGSSLHYTPNEEEIMTGYLGDQILVNGIHAPYVNVATRWYRLRVLNGSTARVYNLGFSDGIPFYVIGSDGGLLRTAEKVSTLLLGPGERIDLLVDFTKLNVGKEIFLISHKFSKYNVQGRQDFKIMKFKIERAETDTFSLPDSFSTIDFLSPSQSVRTRSFDIAQFSGGSGGHGGGGRHSINGKIFEVDHAEETVNSNTTEIWEFDNSRGDEIHPMHIHGVQFQVLQRLGGRNTLIASERGWKDTVLVMPGEKVRVIMTFPEYKGKFVFHCHNLEHEDDGMMLNYEIV